MTGTDRWNFHRKQAIGLIALFFMLSIFIRLPNLNRPISKHYEFNKATLMINILSWRQAGGGDRFHYTPVTNFQNPGDRLPPNNLFIDRKGNSVYLSYGPGWNMISYFFYQAFRLPDDPVYLEILNLIIHFFTVVLFFYFLEWMIPARETYRYPMIIAGCFFMICTPGVLWFLGNGYVNISLLMPFMLGAGMLLVQMLENPSAIKAGRLTMLGLLIILLVYIDWYILFLGFVSAVMALVKIRNQKKYIWLFLLVCLSLFSGIVLIFLQFSSYMGVEAVVNYWLSRSAERSFDLAGSTLLKRISFLSAYFIISFLPLLLLLLTGFIGHRYQKSKMAWSVRELIFLKLFSLSLILYNVILFNWSTDHEFSILPWSVLLSYLTARFLGTMKNRRMARAALAVFIFLCVAQYYWINRPGSVSRDGILYSSFQKFGESLRQVPPDYTICIDMEQNPMIEYYAGRNLLRASDSLTVKNLLNKLGIQKAVWISHRQYQLESVQVIH